MNYGDIIIPDWCFYEEPNAPGSGCYSLLSGFVEGFDYCKNCGECNKSAPKENEEQVIENQRVLRSYLKSL